MAIVSGGGGGAVARSSKVVELDERKLYEFYGAPKPDGVTERSIEIVLHKNAVVKKYEVVIVAAPAHAVTAGEAGQVRTTQSGGSLTVVLDFGTPRTVSAIGAPEGASITSVSTWTGAEFFSPPKYASDGENFVTLPSEVRTERLLVAVSGGPTTDAIANDMVLVLPESPAGIELRIDGAAPVFSQLSAVEPGNTADLSTQSWSSESKRVVDLGPALAAITGDPLDESTVRYLDDKVIQVDENGTMRHKAEILSGLTPLPQGLVGTIAIDHFAVEFHGTIAVAAVEVQERLDYFGQILRSRFRTMDTWRRTSSGWRLIGQQVSAVLKEPPPAVLNPTALCAYNGTYELTTDIRVTLRCAGAGLVAERTDRPPVTYTPASSGLERPRRTSPGARQVTRLKAFANAASDSYPNSSATAATVARRSRSAVVATFIRHRDRSAWPARGHHVSAFSRTRPSIAADSAAVRVVTGDATLSTALDDAVRGRDAVIVTLGTRESALRVRVLGPAATPLNVRSTGTARVIEAMLRHGVRRLVVRSSYGMGDTKAQLPIVWRLIFALLLKPQIDDTEAQEQLVRECPLDWVLARPVSLTDAEACTPEASAEGGVRSMSVSRKTVARFLADAAEGAVRGRTAFSIS